MLTPVSPREPAGGHEWRCGICVQHDDDAAVVYPHGELDVATAPRLNLCLTEVRDNGARDVTVDLTRVSFLDTAGLRVLLEHDRLLRARRGRLRIANASARIMRLLHVTRTAHLHAEDGATPAALAPAADAPAVTVAA